MPEGMVKVPFPRFNQDEFMLDIQVVSSFLAAFFSFYTPFVKLPV